VPEVFGGGPAAPAAASPAPASRPPEPSLDDLVEVVGPFAGDAVLVRRAWLAGLLGVGGVRLARCHRRTGALLDDTDSGSRAYRPSSSLAELVRTRDGRCRFPGCAVAARFCDLDHVRPWPAGPTAAVNMMCLCRRHHRIKQRPGWGVRLSRDGRADWTDPVGRQRTTWPRDLLDLVVLPAPTMSAPPGGGPSPQQSNPAEASPKEPPHESPEMSTLETILDVILDGHRAVTGPGCRARVPASHGHLAPPWADLLGLAYRETPNHAHARRRGARGLTPPPPEHQPPPF
jgi:hypothetical protein